MTISASAGQRLARVAYGSHSEERTSQAERTWVSTSSAPLGTVEQLINAKTASADFSR